VGVSATPVHTPVTFAAITMARGGFYSLDSLRGVHVLVVDYEADGRDLLSAVLHYCGALFRCICASRSIPGSCAARSSVSYGGPDRAERGAALRPFLAPRLSGMIRRE